jgi:hypothetical protein
MTALIHSSLTSAQHHQSQSLSLNNELNYFFILNFRLFVNVVFFLLGDTPVREFSVPTFRGLFF